MNILGYIKLVINKSVMPKVIFIIKQWMYICYRKKSENYMKKEKEKRV